VKCQLVFCFPRTACRIMLCCYSTAGRGAEYHDEHVCVGVCLYVCVSVSDCEHISATTHQFFCECSYSCGSVLLWQHCDKCCVLPVLWMTSCLHIMARKWRCEEVYTHCDSTGCSTDSTPRHILGRHSSGPQEESDIMFALLTL